MQKIPFSKMHGAGNDFIVLSENEFTAIRTKEQMRYLCHRRLGVGSDGIIVIGQREDYDFEMRFINPDASEGMFCGNGSRCAVAKAYEWGWIGQEGVFLAVDGTHRAIYHGPEDIEVQMIDVAQIESKLNGYFLNTGAPHYVEMVSALQERDVEKEGRKIRYDDTFAPLGTNANFVEELEGSLHIRTYERGVEKETLACGTGITASALAFHLQCKPNDTLVEYAVVARGGTVHISAEYTDGIYKNVMMRGPVKKVFDAEISIPNNPFEKIQEIPIIKD